MTTCDNYFEQDPDDLLDYGIDWAPWLLTNNQDEIQTHEWVVPDGLTVSDEDSDESFALAWFTGGVAGVVYPIISRIVTVANRHKDQTIFLRIEEN